MLREARLMLHEVHLMLREVRLMLREARLMLREVRLMLREARLMLHEARLILEGPLHRRHGPRSRCSAIRLMFGTYTAATLVMALNRAEAVTTGLIDRFMEHFRSSGTPELAGHPARSAV